MKSGEKYDLIVPHEDEGPVLIGTVALVRDLEDKEVRELISTAWPLFQHGPDRDDFTNEEEYEDAADEFGDGQPDCDSEFIAFLAEHYPDTFREAEQNHQIELD